MESIQDHRDLRVWKQSVLLATHVYSLCKKIPSSEQFGIISQMQRAAISIPSNIAEGHERSTRNDYAHFLYIAKGSAAELETQLTILPSLYPPICTIELLSETTVIRKMLSALISALKTKQKSA